MSKCEKWSLMVIVANVLLMLFAIAAVFVVMQSSLSELSVDVAVAVVCVFVYWGPFTSNSTFFALI